ncbi:hypothetical protein [Salinimicrobium xinjiangense]|uniref:hypothetical protein n=1 Tax=Salinimicrobium xinjiangense TaxID=438596 RepID=UPI0003F7F90B|nr:hypothetical protein [Salinimicrobium xinjiangense]
MKMDTQQPAPGDRSTEKHGDQPEKKESKLMAGLKKVGFHVWLAVMIIGGALAFITALFLV